MFAYRDTDHLLDRKDFVSHLTGTRAIDLAPYDPQSACNRRAELTPVRRWILDAAEAMVERRGTGDTSDAWLSEEATCGTLARLAEEAERNGDQELRGRVLDAWGRLIERESHHAVHLLESSWEHS